MFVTALVLTALGTFALGLLVGRGWVVFLSLIVWPIIMLGLAQDWWGSGTGELGGLAMLIGMLVALAAGVLGVGARRLGGSVLRERST